MTSSILEPATLPNGFSQTQNAVIALLGNALCEAHLPIPGKADWRAVLDEMIAQTVFAIPRDSLPNTVRADVKSDWENLCLRNVATTIQLLSQQSEATKLLSAHDPTIVVLKGAAAAIYYPDPILRCMGDIDLISLDGRFDDMCDLLQISEYKRIGKGGESHDQYTKNGILLEPHRFFAAPPESRLPIRAVDETINSASSNIRAVSICGFEAPVLPDAENGLVLLAHLALHMKRGVGLRHLCDWMMFVARICDDAFWEKEFEPLAQRTGLRRLAEVATRACQLYLGLPEDGLSWCATADPYLCKLLLDDAFANGNFGRKRTSVLHYGDGMRRYNPKHPITLLKNAQHAGQEKLEKKGFGRSAAVLGLLYQGRYLAARYQKLKPAIEAQNAQAALKSRSDLMEGLGLADL